MVCLFAAAFFLPFFCSPLAVFVCLLALILLHLPDPAPVRPAMLQQRITHISVCLQQSARLSTRQVCRPNTRASFATRATLAGVNQSNFAIVSAIRRSCCGCSSNMLLLQLLWLLLCGQTFLWAVTSAYFYNYCCYCCISFCRPQHF